MLSTKDLVFKERLVKKLIDWYISLYIIEKVVFTNIIKLRLLTLIKIYLVVNIGQVVKYRELVEKQKVKKTKSIEVEEVKK